MERTNKRNLEKLPLSRTEELELEQQNRKNWKAKRNEPVPQAAPKSDPVIDLPYFTAKITAIDIGKKKIDDTIRIDKKLCTKASAESKAIEWLTHQYPKADFADIKIQIN